MHTKSLVDEMHTSVRLEIFLSPFQFHLGGCNYFTILSQSPRLPQRSICKIIIPNTYAFVKCYVCLTEKQISRIYAYSDHTPNCLKRLLIGLWLTLKRQVIPFSSIVAGHTCDFGGFTVSVFQYIC